MFRLTTLAATVAASFGAHAALYNVYLQAPEGASTSRQTYGVAVTPETNKCWTSACSENTSNMAVEVKNYREGFKYRDESPFFIPFGFDYLDDGDDWTGFRNYCSNLLGYTRVLCDEWATAQYTNGYAIEKSGNYQGSLTYIDTNQVYGENSVINSLTKSGVTVEAIGSRRTGTSRSVAFNQAISGVDLPLASNKESRAWDSVEFDNGSGNATYTVGSVSTAYAGSSISNNSNAAIWKDNVLEATIGWDGGAVNGNYLAQGSARDITVFNSKLYAVGYNSASDVRFTASVFESSDGSSWTKRSVTGFPYALTEYASQSLHTVNENGIAVGSAKLNQALNGAYANTLFYVDDLNNPTYKALSGGIFFSGVNGQVGAINNSNDLVGTIDYETSKEINGRPRAKRAFIVNLGASAHSNNNPAPLGGQARYLDDLTSGDGATQNNNQFRIIEAADINDAGVIAATAYYCAGGYDSEAVNAACSTDATLVGVKLVPIAGQTAADITPRPVVQSTISRQGGSLGLILLTVLGFIGLRRK
ncbi:DUF3466 family protein [Vibrio sinaloensis]|uniref:DUF3466 family protein n=1 Tax=Photobacterium sp. (strain ATCC 43367) TaxID=379097 RepID=UPI0020555D98|nr:DUF3466 family protein [Vibrio sinaloensis]UPQ86788.1 DUF3466 family protein [Vibrio sinaloensis]